MFCLNLATSHPCVRKRICYVMWAYIYSPKQESWQGYFSSIFFLHPFFMSLKGDKLTKGKQSWFRFDIHSLFNTSKYHRLLYSGVTFPNIQGLYSNKPPKWAMPDHPTVGEAWWWWLTLPVGLLLTGLRMEMVVVVGAAIPQKSLVGRLISSSTSR